MLFRGRVRRYANDFSCGRGKMVEKVFDIIKDNLKNPKLYIALLTIIVVILLLFPYIDANFFYYNRVEKRIDILKAVSDIETEKIENNPILKAEYENILEEISKQKEGSLGSVFITNNTSKVSRYKFLTGAILSWLVGVLCLFIKIDKVSQRIVGILLFAILGCILGYISTLIPTIIDPKCNYILMPILQLVLLGVLVTNNKNS